MMQLEFRCRLLTDVILNSSSASETNNSTLDFIPGSCFLGIVARNYAHYAQEGLAHALFHNGKVQYGDAHPAYEQGGKWLRSWRTPAALFRPKLNKSECYVHYAIPDPKALVPLQLRQERKGFWAFETSGNVVQAHPVNPTTNFTLKSAYDSVHRRAKDEHLFGYEALRAGMDFLFTVVVEEEDVAAAQHLAEVIVDVLRGKQRVGRSRSAQYGLVEITPCKYETVCPSLPVKDGCVAVYADSRLCFTDEWGMPTAMPTAQQLGFAEGAEVDWGHSQVRTFRYSPWNAKRGYADAERFGIEKGSVLLVRATAVPDHDAAVGEYRHEGFGRVCYNPVFLKADTEGRSAIQFWENTSASTVTPRCESGYTSPLLSYLQARKQAEEVENSIYDQVRAWMKDYATHFADAAFASQWGTIRSLAMQYPNAEQLVEKLFGLRTFTEHPRFGETDKGAYLCHGVAQEKWNERQRISKLYSKFVCPVFQNLGAPHLAPALINLSSQMAKHCKR